MIPPMFPTPEGDGSEFAAGFHPMAMSNFGPLAPLFSNPSGNASRRLAGFAPGHARPASKSLLSRL